MYILMEIRDGTRPADICRETVVDMYCYQEIDDAIIAAEPENIRDEVFVIVDRSGFFGVVPRTEGSNVPEIIKKWKNPDLARYFFEAFEAFEGSA